MDPNNLLDFDTFYEEMVEDYINDNSAEEYLRLVLESQHNGKHRRRRKRSSAQPMGQETAKRKLKSIVENNSSSNIHMSTMEAAMSERYDLMVKLAIEKNHESMIKLYEILMKDTSHMSEQQKADHVLCCDVIKRQFAQAKKEDEQEEIQVQK